MNHSLHVNPDLESGVVKIQRREEAALTNAEKVACECLLLHPVGARIINSDNESLSSSAKNEFDDEDIEQSQYDGPVNEDDTVWRPKYINYDFIIGSAAEFERLWSIGKHTLEDDGSVYI